MTKLEQIANESLELALTEEWERTVHHVRRIIGDEAFDATTWVRAYGSCWNEEAGFGLVNPPDFRDHPLALRDHLDVIYRCGRGDLCRFSPGLYFTASVMPHGSVRNAADLVAVFAFLRLKALCRHCIEIRDLKNGIVESAHTPWRVSPGPRGVLWALAGFAFTIAVALLAGALARKFLP